MQGGTRRPRSDSEDELVHTEDQRPRRRQRHSPTANSTTTSITAPFLETRDHKANPDLANISQTHRSHSQPTSMGPPILGHREGEAGPSNGHSNCTSTMSHANWIHHITRIDHIGKLMYEEDKDWEHEGENDVYLHTDGEDAYLDQARTRLSRPGAKRMPVDREEIVRLMMQGLRDMGYNQSAKVLEAETGYSLSSGAATDFQHAILGGRWSEGLALLPALGIDVSASVSIPIKVEEPSSSGNSINEGSGGSFMGGGTGTIAEQAKFLVSQQKYLEYLELGQQKKALSTLRMELAPVAKDQEVLHSLSGYMMCLDKEDLYERASWDGAAGSSRRKLLEQLQTFISPQVMVPERRLATLLDQARQYQAQTCMYHQDAEVPSLYTDHECRPGQFPSVTTHILADHTDEVWRIEWSPDGSMLASAGKDKQVVIWQLELLPKIVDGSRWKIRPLHHLRDHRDPVDAMSWSPDGKTLVTGADKGLYLWDTQTGLQKTTAMGQSPHGDQISAIQWKQDGSEFLVSSMDCKLVFYSKEGTVVRQWAFNTTQIVDFVITPDDQRIVALTTSLKRIAIENKLKQSSSTRPEDPPRQRTSQSHNESFAYGSMEHGMMIIRLADKEVIDWSQDLKCEITGIKLSWDGKRVILSCSPDEVQMWALEPHLRPIRNFKGHIQSRFLIRSCFGAVKDRFILSGSEDGHVYVWQASSPHPIQVLAGHDETVNSVSWNPVASRKLFASCSDDGTVRIWQPPGLEETGDDADEVFEAKEEPEDNHGSISRLPHRSSAA